MNVGVIGLGRMGWGIAHNILKSGATLFVHDIDRAAASSLVAGGASWCARVDEIGRSVDVLFTSLPGPMEFEQVVDSPAGVIAHMRSDGALFDLSTNSLSLVRRLHDKFRARGLWLLDAPVSGGPAGAASGDLAVWVGGERAIYDRHHSVLKAIAKQPRHVGPIGAGTVTKLSHNMLGYSFMLSLAEVFSTAVKAGIDPLELWEAMRLGMACKGSPLNMLVNQFLPGRYEPAAFALKLAHKDVTLATAMARDLGVPMRLANLTREEMTEALARGFGDQDSRAYLKLQLERAGVTIAVDDQRLKGAVARVASL